MFQIQKSGTLQPRSLENLGIKTPQQSTNAQGPGTTAKTAAAEDFIAIVQSNIENVKWYNPFTQ